MLTPETAVLGPLFQPPAEDVEALPPLPLDVPVVSLDLESTGTKVDTAKIVEICLVRLHPTGAVESFGTYVNPGMPIPAEATAIHGITNERVAAAPTFSAIAQHVVAFLGDAALTGYGVKGFDIPVLEREFLDIGMEVDLSARPVIDGKPLYHQLHPRRLVDAYREYCGGTIEDAHRAGQDARAWLLVFAGMLARHPELPRSAVALSAMLSDPRFVETSGRFVWVDGDATFAFSKHAGKSLRWVAQNEPSFLEWMLSKDFKPSVKRIVRQALGGHFPTPPQGAASADPADK